MTQDDIIEMAKQAGIEEAYSLEHSQVLVRYKDGSLESFAKLVAAKEREACAQVCHEVYAKWVCESDEDVNYPDPNDCIRAIRARGEA